LRRQSLVLPLEALPAPQQQAVELARLEVPLVRPR
jgi:hypothetical protein